MWFMLTALAPRLLTSAQVINILHFEDAYANPVLPRRYEEIPFGHPPSIPTRFLIEEVDFCTEERNPRLRTIGFVLSTISAVGKRATTRRTWANSDISRKYGFRMAVVFIVGRAKNKREEQILEKESVRYHDMVQVDFEDHYDLLTYKTLAGLVWVHRHCSHVPWTFKADDDILIDDFLFVEKIKEIQVLGVEHKFYCALHPNRPVFREGGLGVLPEEFPEDYYPPYCSGSMWFMLTALAPRLLTSAQVINILHIEDAYVTGLLARQAGIGHTPHVFSIFWKLYSEFHKEDFGKILVWVLLNEKSRDEWPALIPYHLNKKKI
ncbi:beta-1,3-galactosyltransferase 2-like [Oratosquilla oratoria]|uniref:beta-1,3-galactosyltransferase 2-like n=1 Tax=Oratosquilla oratoria TaxID=337810 RepID=UPI003F762D64